MPNEISVVFIIKELGNGFEGQFEYHGKNTAKYKIFSVPIEKERIKIRKDGNENVATISYETKFIDSARFLASSLSSLSDNHTEGIHKILIYRL